MREMAPRLNFMTLSVDIKTLIVQHVSVLAGCSGGTRPARSDGPLRNGGPPEG